MSTSVSGVSFSFFHPPVIVNTGLSGDGCEDSCRALTEVLLTYDTAMPLGCNWQLCIGGGSSSSKDPA